uniref:NADH dehydrogenase [ubiquinone] 1 beta subcomplex subunit 9 n=1 Tax=Aureoumbra lagunensis TaxID=44058 RepID=A0A7S3JR60_9STRA|mmetsp:Transcript_4269/g.6034  ORF Transcript_4269/g.6034 Transcript_4269/m.6034 type:complete len:160 (+) Transcript_4269:72-551(+)
MNMNMNSVFRAAAAQFKSPEPVLTHAQRVCRLYRRSLKLTFSWAFFRDLYIQEAEKLRAEFDANASLDPNSRKAQLLVENGEAKLWEMQHPDPYVVSYAPGGTSFMRNPTLPNKIVYNFDVPEGLPEEKFVNPDMTPVRQGEKGTVGAVLVDFATKTMS